jgi:DUF1009 family protein
MAVANVVGLIAGEGRLPYLVADGARAKGLKVICVGLAGSAEPALAGKVDVFYDVSLARPGDWIRKLKKNGVTSAVMVGRVAKSRIFTPWRIARYIPDWRAFRIWYWRLRGRDKQNETLLSALADELAGGGITLDDSTKYCKEHLATSGTMTGRGPSASIQSDIEFGWIIARRIAEMDIGQAIAVREREVIAVEAIEGTAEMIERAGRHCKAGGWTLIKVSKPGQDMRFDVPCVGTETIRQLAANGGKCLVVEAGRTIIIDKPQTLELADHKGICVIGK